MKITNTELKTLDNLFEEMYAYAIQFPGIKYNDKYKTLREFHKKIQEELKK